MTRAARHDRTPKTLPSKTDLVHGQEANARVGMRDDEAFMARANFPEPRTEQARRGELSGKSVDEIRRDERKRAGVRPHPRRATTLRLRRTKAPGMQGGPRPKPGDQTKRTRTVDSSGTASTRSRADERRQDHGRNCLTRSASIGAGVTPSSGLPSTARSSSPSCTRTRIE